MARDAATGMATIRAIRLGGRPFLVDGQLDEAVYTEHPPFGGLLQASPKSGEAPTEKTEMWVLFDEANIYVSARCYDQAPPEAWIANELRRDTNQMRQNDHFGVGFDTFYDRRSGFMFYANPIGGFSDYSVVDEGAPNSDWNPVWSVRTGRFDGGWTLEMAIPFKSLRYMSGENQVWGIQFRRSIRHKNEWDYWTPVPRQTGRSIGAQPRLGLRHRGGARPAGREQQHRAEALRARQADDRPRPRPACLERGRRAVRRRLQVRRHRQPHGRRDGEHRLRAGGDRRAAGQPHALQPVPAGEARLLPRGARHVRFRARRWRRGRGRRRGHERPAVPVLQPAHRPQSQPRDPDRRRRPADRQDRRVRRRDHEHPGGRRVRLPHAGDELHRGPRQARHPAAQHDRRDGHQPVRVVRDAPGGATRGTAWTRRSASTRT